MLRGHCTDFSAVTGPISAHSCSLALTYSISDADDKQVKLRCFFFTDLCMHPIEHAKLHYNDQGTPVSDTFDDVYFSNESGLDETRYVFLQHNGLPERWLTARRRHFHVIETGFGTGLNFLLCWQAFRQHRLQAPHAICQQLYFSTFEKYPLQAADLAKALQAWPSLAELAAALLQQYPAAIAGCHRLQFDDGSVTLNLWLGDVADNLPLLPASAVADAWFLDGFAPSKNPQMWQDFLFAGMARLSKPGTTVATFTSAGIVRRGLQSAGFHVKKVKGFGRKREMAIGVMPTEAADGAEYTQCELSQHDAEPLEPITIVGGGLASVLLALSLWQKGQSVTLLCAESKIAQGASHNRQGALYPQLQTALSPVSQFHLQAFGFACRRYQQLQQLFAFPASNCGVLTLNCNDKLIARAGKIAALSLPIEVLQPVDAIRASELAGIKLPFAGLFYPAGGWIAPQTFCQAAIGWLSQQTGFQLRLDCAVQAIHRADSVWQLNTSQGMLQTSQLVLCTGHRLNELLTAMPLQLNTVRGQVSHVTATGLSQLNTVLCHQGYITPGGPHVDDQSCVGATFDRDNKAALVTAADDVSNLALVNQVFSNPSWFADATVHSAKAGLRATVPDHLPYAGKRAAGLWVLGGLGARGLLFAPLLAEQLSCQLSQQPSVLPESLAMLIDCQRFDK